MIKSPLRYPGGKSRAVQRIVSLLPNFEEFREPFVGGGSVFLTLKQLNPNKEFWINDLYADLYKFWEYSQKDLKAVVNQVSLWKTQFETGRDLYRFLSQNLSLFQGVEKASAFFVLNRITFSGTIEAGGYSEQAFLDRFTKTSVERLSFLKEVLTDVRITNLDYKEVVEKEGKEVLIYLDPPYFSVTNSFLYGKNGELHKVFDHERFVQQMKSCNHKWLITYNNCDYIKDLFSFANIQEFSLVYGMKSHSKGSNQVGKEIFISNF